MISSFHKQFNVLHEASGSYVSGVWVAGARSIITIKASVQPLNGNDMITPPEGRRLNDMVKIYTFSDLQVTKEGDSGLQPDMIAWRGYAYEIISVNAHQMDVISHFKYSAIKRMELPVGYETSWANGTLPRGII